MMTRFDGYHLIPASEWVLYPESVQAEMRLLGAYPVNDAFIPIWERPRVLKRELVILYGTYGCFYGEQSVCTPNGSVNIKDINVGDLVYCFDGTKKVVRPVTNTFIYKNVKGTIKITLNNGCEIIATEDHKFLYGTSWIRLKDLLTLWYGKEMVSNPGLQQVYGKYGRRNKKHKVEQSPVFKDNETFLCRERLLSNDVDGGRWEIPHAAGTSFDMSYILGKTRGGSIGGKPYRRGQTEQSTREFRVGNEKAEYATCLEIGSSLYSQRGASSYVSDKRGYSKGNKAEIQKKGLYKGNVGEGVWNNYFNSQKGGFASNLEPCDIKSFQFVSDVEYVYDIEVSQYHNFYLDCIKPICVHNSSKTHDRILEHLLLSMTEKYFKCYFGRSVFDLAKSEFHSSIVSVIKREGWTDLFDYSEKANGTKEIVCKVTGNKFKPFGCDDEESIGKGWDDATHIMLDEGNQISFKQFGMLQSRARKKGVPKAFTMMFNNCDVLPDHWICTHLLNKEAELTDDEGKVVERNLIEHCSTFRDNYFIDQEEYKNQLIEQCGNDPVRLSAVLNAEWGSSTTGQPFYKMFDVRKHVNRCAYDPSLVLHVTWDENVNPYLPVSIWQIRGLSAFCIDEIAAKNPYNTLRWVCSEIERRYGEQGKDHQAGMIIYGDATSRKDDVKQEKGKDFFVLCKEYLKCFNPRLRVGRSNPNVAMRGNFINDILSKELYGLNITISPVCKTVIADFQHTKEAPDGGKDKTKEKIDGVGGVQRHGHFTDGCEYFICEAFYSYYSKFQHGGKSVNGYFAPRKSRHAY